MTSCVQQYCCISFLFTNDAATQLNSISLVWGERNQNDSPFLYKSNFFQKNLVIMKFDTLLVVSSFTENNCSDVLFCSFPVIRALSVNFSCFEVFHMNPDTIYRKFLFLVGPVLLVTAIIYYAARLS